MSTTIHRGDTVTYVREPNRLMTAISEPERFGGGALW